MERTYLRGSPDRIFISVNEDTGMSTVSFFPADVGSPIQHESDNKGTRALEDAKTLTAKYPNATVHGPHFHATRPVKAASRRRRP